MGACMSSEPSSGDVTQALVVDVQKVIADHVWKNFYASKLSRREKARVKRRDYTVDVPMNYFYFDKTGQELTIKNPGNGDHTNQSSSLQGKLPNADKTSPQQKGLQTHYRNDTGEAQVYQFNFEKTRRSSARVSFQKGFSFGGKTDFSLELPKILPGGGIGAELDMHMEVRKTEEQAFEEESTTAVTSAITVSPFTLCVANVVLEDTHFTADYKVYVTMEMPAKSVPVTIRNKEGEIMCMQFADNLSFIFPKAHHIKDAQGSTRRDAVQFVVEGVITGTQVSNQKIQLDSHPLKQ